MIEHDIRLLPPTFSPWTPTEPANKRIAVLMSGGVDSSVTAHLLRRAGWEVLGITMKIPVACGVSSPGCCGADAAFVCAELSIPHYFIDVTAAFNDAVIQPFRAAYAEGRTPNPCVDCNAILKFSLVWDRLEEEFSITQVATGHYAQVIHDGESTCLRRAADKDKDQSYFLYGVPRRRLPSLVLPLGNLTKPQVRTLAAELNLSVAAKAESMELCFAGEQDYRAALESDSAHHPGDMTDMQGRKIGTHRGIANYTLGQRRGLGFAGGQPLYVGRIDAVNNTVALGTREQVSTPLVRAGQCHTLLPERLTLGAKLFGKIRSYGDPRPCTLVDLRACLESSTGVPPVEKQGQDGPATHGQDAHATASPRLTHARTPDTMAVEFEQPQFAPCPGQRLVLYDEQENVVAGGVIQT